MTLVVQKYGGSSVGSLDHIRGVAQHVHATVRQGHQVIVTISAMGEQTDELLAMAHQLGKKPPRRELDMLLTSGERISAALLSIALADRGVDAMSLTGSQCGILTDETHGNARIKRITGERIRDSLGQGRVVIVAGFQGVSPRTKEITTLGRGGTDLSAVALAASLGAKVCQFYKDVDGIFTADPRAVPSARLLREISWSAMNALAWAGASVLQPRSCHLAAKFDIPLEIRSSIHLDRSGTIVKGRPTVESPRIEAMAQKSGVTLLVCRARHQAPLAAALDFLWRQGEAPLVSQQRFDGDGGEEITLVVKTAFADDCLALLGGEVVRRVDKLTALTVVGEGFQQSPETIAAACAALPSRALVLDARNTALTFCLPEAEAPAAAKALHKALLEATPA